MSQTRPQIFERFLLALILLFYGVMLAQPINMETADLGRHLKNGELFFNNFQIPHTNLYSYTHADFPFINHHWGAGVIFYSIFKISGFRGLSIFFIIVSLVTFLLFFHIAWRWAGFGLPGILSILAIPVLAARVEIRPEILSYFFASVFFWILWNYRAGKISKRFLYLLPFLQLVWVNTHIYFFLGGVITLAFAVESAVQVWIKKDRSVLVHAKMLAFVFVMLGVAVLLNPSGIRGALYPLFILQNFGYRLFENQSFWFIESLFSYPPALYFKILFIVFILSWAAVFKKVLQKEADFPVALFLLSLFFGSIALYAVRNFAIFSYFALTVSAVNFSQLKIFSPKRENHFTTAVLIILFLAIILIINPAYWSSRGSFGLGLADGTTKAADFFKARKIQGPVFNNYDIGGYLIYYLYPRAKVFVDNRPEAYPAAFFHDIYIPMQEDENKWHEQDAKYNFNTIFFWRNDLTPWGQKFLITRIKDPAWAAVYLDNYAIIFLKRIETNKAVIAKYEIPASVFSTSQK